jgi:hypothetical protein
VRDVRQLVLHPERQPVVREQPAALGVLPFVVGDAEQGRHNLTLTRDPQPGDIVVYKFGSNTFKHIGLFEKWTDRGRGKFAAIEGNTSQASDDNGGEVQRRQRDTSGGTTFVHVGK